MLDRRTNILMAGAFESYLPRSIKNGLTEKGLNVTFSKGSIKDLEIERFSYRAFILFADSEFNANMQFIVFLKDLAIEKDVPVFLIGYEEDVENMLTILPAYIVKKSFLRPINANEAETEILKILNQNKTINKKRILVVDDSPTDLRAMRTLLSDTYQVALASSGTAAIMYLSQDHPDLILLDYEMPVVNGKQVLQMIRGEKAYSKTPVIFLTSHGDRESIMNVVNLRPDGYLLKSMNHEMIKGAIDDFFMKQKNLMR